MKNNSALANIGTNENHLSTFINKDFGRVRIITQDEDLWFVAKDICEALNIQNSRQALMSLDDDEKGVCKIYTLGEEQDSAIINEAGLYSLILRSNKPEAKEFKRWITHEVLPSIRKYGFYGTERFVENALSDPSGMIAILEKYRDEQLKRYLAEQQRDHAIETKAHISRRREATAMNTASQLSKENSRLKEQVGDSKIWKQARSISWLKDFFILNNTAYIQIGKRLSDESRLMGYEIREIEHSKWNSVKTYHSDVIDHFRYKLIDDQNFMKKYRKFIGRCL